MSSELDLKKKQTLNIGKRTVKGSDNDRFNTSIGLNIVMLDTINIIEIIYDIRNNKITVEKNILLRIRIAQLAAARVSSSAASDEYKRKVHKLGETSLQDTQ